MQSAQAIGAAYYFDLAPRDYILADGAIELVIEGAPWSAFIIRRKATSLSSPTGRIVRELKNRLAEAGKSVAICKHIRRARRASQAATV